MPTLLGALSAGASARAAMVHVVLLALGTAAIADVCVQTSDLLYRTTVARHGARGEAAHLGAIDIELDALGERLRIGLGQACARAVVTLRRARLQGVNRCLITFVCHLHLLVLSCVYPDRGSVLAFLGLGRAL